MNNKIFFLWIFFFLAPFLFSEDAMSPVQSELYAMGFGIPRQPLESVDFNLEDLDGRGFSLSEQRGNLVFLNFWATWCGPCRSEMPSMEELYTLLRDKDFEIFAVASLKGDSRNSIRSYVESNEFSFPVLLDPEGNLGAAYSVQGIPTTYIIGKDGYIVARLVGAYDWSNRRIVEILSDLADEG